jgi:hypothetical protein
LRRAAAAPSGPVELKPAEDGRIAYRMKRPLPDGTTHLLFTGLEIDPALFDLTGATPLSSSGSGLAPAWGTRNGRSCAPGAKTPWNLVRFVRGGGTRDAARRNSSNAGGTAPLQGSRGGSLSRGAGCPRWPSSPWRRAAGQAWPPGAAWLSPAGAQPRWHRQQPFSTSPAAITGGTLAVAPHVRLFPTMYCSRACTLMAHRMLPMTATETEGVLVPCVSRRRAA